MISDTVLGRSNPWTELFDPGRKALARGLWDYVKENADYPYYLISRSICRPGGEVPACRETWPGNDHRPKWRESRSVSRHGWCGYAPRGDLHAHGMRGGLEPSGADMGLPMPRITIQADRSRYFRPGRDATVRSEVNWPDVAPAFSRCGYSVPVCSCGASTGFDSGEPRCRRTTLNSTIAASARNSLCQF